LLRSVDATVCSSSWAKLRSVCFTAVGCAHFTAMAVCHLVHLES
jgi:hypothetical protein